MKKNLKPASSRLLARTVAFWITLGLIAFAHAAEPVPLFKVVDADFSNQITVDGKTGDWARLQSGIISMDTRGRGLLAVDIKYAWDTNYLYILVKENTNTVTDALQQEAPDGDTYVNKFYLFDGIAFWIDLDNDAGTITDGVALVEDNADFQPWFGFSSSGRTDLIYGRVNNSGTLNLDGLANARVATGGSFANHDRVIEVAIQWSDVATAVDPSRQPGGDLLAAIKDGYTFGSEPLLLDNDYNGQGFIGPDQYRPPSGMDENSRDIRLVTSVAAPRLDIRLEQNKVVITWPASTAGFGLQSTDSLMAPNWMYDLDDPEVQEGINKKITVSPPSGGRFFRLRKD